ncbi:MAG: aminotransferase class V-fold PLP-dependent enzyme [Bacteroidales bacterium]|nr:MAG: aminotransferase class V-fold PLP-dependent enzyme [Bacteroidales bacterium]
MMKTDRRQFLANSIAAAGAVAVGSFLNKTFGRDLPGSLINNDFQPPVNMVTEEEFWYWIQQSFTASPNVMNLNNGGVCPQPKVVQDAFEHYNRVSNEGPAYYMWQVVGEGREAVRKDLARLAGCSPEEIAIQRNTTEALETVIFGMNLKKGDEVVLTRQDYPNMINAWKQREKRDGIVLKWINLPQPVEDDDLIVKAYEDAFTSRTKVIEIMHMINWSGQILPARKIARAAHKQGIDVLVDGAHTFAHLDFTIPDLECEYFGTSLHKWLYAPFGTGMLYIKKDKIGEIWPLTAPGEPESDDIRKFEAMGTRSFPAELAIGKAIDFHHMIGSARKENRLNFLRNYWMEKIRDIPKIKFYTSFKPEYACGLGNFAIEGMTPGELQKILFSKYKIFTVPIDWENIYGVRITPNVYTTPADLDYFVEAVKEIAAG